MRLLRHNYSYVLFFFFNAIAIASGQQRNPLTEHQTTIDNLQTADQVQNFVRSHKKADSAFSPFDSSDLKDPLVPKLKFWFDSLHVRTWYKADFDGNGFNDLVVMGKSENTMVIMAGAGEQFTEYTLQSSSGFVQLPIIEKINGKTVIILFHEKEENWFSRHNHFSLECDTLFFKHNNFIDYRQWPDKCIIKEIDFETQACFGTCPVFKLSLKKNGSARFKGIQYNKRNKVLMGRIDLLTFDSITSILNEIAFTRLKDSFLLPASDLPSYTLRITYDKGKVKTIYNYGYSGTPGMTAIENKIFDFMRNK